MKNQMNEILKKSLEANPASPFLSGLVGAMDPSEREAFERFRELRLTQKSTRPHETKPNEMNMNKTPETDALRDLYENHEHHANIGDIWDLCECLERRLTIDREALETLAKLGNGQHYGNSDGNIIALAALTQTAPKQ